ncbi:MAG: hypothetical protein AAGF95_14540 [Chloroflexota bacterium]
MGTGRPESANKPFFALWSDGTVDIHAICLELSTRVSPICMAWKSEHGGVGGYFIYRDGVAVSRVERSDALYAGLPRQGVEATFGSTLPLNADESVVFPELLFDDAMACYLVKNGSQQALPVPSTVVRQLQEMDLVVEPVLPSD